MNVPQFFLETPMALEPVAQVQPVIKAPHKKQSAKLETSNRGRRATPILVQDMKTKVNEVYPSQAIAAAKFGVYASTISRLITYKVLHRKRWLLSFHRTADKPVFTTYDPNEIDIDDIPESNDEEASCYGPGRVPTKVVLTHTKDRTVHSFRSQKEAADFLGVKASAVWQAGNRNGTSKQWMVKIVKAPVVAKVKARVVAPVDARVVEQVKAHVKATVEASVEAPAEAPAEAPVEAPAEAPAEAPVVAPPPVIQTQCECGGCYTGQDNNHNQSDMHREWEKKRDVAEVLANMQSVKDPEIKKVRQLHGMFELYKKMQTEGLITEAMYTTMVNRHLGLP